MYLGTPVVSVDASGGAPAPASIPFPTGWAGGTARVLRYAARLTTSGTVTWTPASTSVHSTSVDPGFVGSLLDVSDADMITATVDASGATMGGSPTASAYLAVLAAISDGTNLTPAVGADAGVLTTNHPYFETVNAATGSTWVQAVVTLGGTPPTITDGNGFTWTQLMQQQFGAGYLTVWTAPINRNTASSGEQVLLSETCDSGIGFALVGQTP